MAMYKGMHLAIFLGEYRFRKSCISSTTKKTCSFGTWNVEKYWSSLLGEFPLLKLSINRYKGYSIKKQVTFSDKNGIFSTPWTKTGIFLTPLGHKTGFFYPLGQVFFLWPLEQFCPIFLGQFFLSILPPPHVHFVVNFTPPRKAFLPILPPWTVYFDNFTPSDIFLKMLPPSDTFSWDPLGQKIAAF